MPNANIRLFYNNTYYKLYSNDKSENFSWWIADDGTKEGPFWSEETALNWGMRHGKIIRG